jgi:hypothetical protein
MPATRKAKPAGAEAAEAKPVTLSKGRYAIYEAPNGDGVISYRPDGQEADQHQVVPAKFWTVLTGIASGQVTDLNPVSLLKMIMAGK